MAPHLTVLLVLLLRRLAYATLLETLQHYSIFAIKSFPPKISRKFVSTHSVPVIDLYHYDNSIFLRRKFEGKTNYIKMTATTNGPLKITSINNIPCSENKKFANAEAIFGLYKLNHKYFLCVVSDSEPANLLDPITGIREVKEMKFIALTRSSKTSNQDDKNISLLEQKTLQLLVEAARRHTFYYSTSSYDVTRTVQFNCLTYSKSSWRSSDDRYFWNFNPVGEMISQGVDDVWITPVVNAWITTESIAYRGHNLTLTLISRRSRLRQGPRYVKRGVDAGGNVANMVETEQILFGPKSSISSFVQARGSIPIFWSQPEVWKPRPSIVVAHDILTNAKATKTHLWQLATELRHNSEISKTPTISSSHTITRHCKSVTLVNLIDKSGSQGELGQWFAFSLWQAASSNVSLLSSVRPPPRGKLQAPNLASIKSLASESEAINLDFMHDNSEEFYQSTDKIPATFLSERNHLTDRSKTSEMTIQLNIADKYNSTTANSACDTLKVQLLWFDYHSRCSKGRAGELSDLHLHLGHILDSDEGFFVAKYNGLTEQQQKHIIRTNCVDCLDRTNVVQTAIGRWALLRQLKAVIEVTDFDPRKLSSQLPDKQLEQTFRRMWGENGDHISMLYAGTCALKRDVTITGKRTKIGAVEDALASATRYYINNWRDVDRQIGIDFLLGYIDGKDVIGTRRPIFYNHEPERSQLGNDSEWIEQSIVIPQNTSIESDMDSESTQVWVTTAQTESTVEARSNSLIDSVKQTKISSAKISNADDIYEQVDGILSNISETLQEWISRV